MYINVEPVTCREVTLVKTSSEYFKMIKEYSERHGDRYDGKTSGQEWSWYGINVVVNGTNIFW